MSNKRVMSASDFGKVAVLMGGRSAEREISLISGQAVLTALLEQGVDAHKVDVGLDISQQLVAGQFDRAFNVLHGRGGEDGQIQGVLQSLAIPFTGSDVTGAVLSMNKMISKQIWLQQGLPTAAFEQVTIDSDVNDLATRLGLPLMVKPVNEGSSIGMTKVNTKDDLAKAITLATHYDAEVIVETWISGEEYTVAILDQQALPVIQLKTPHEFYDFDAKYKANTTHYLCPCGLAENDEKYCQQLALDAFNALRMKGWGRIDLMRDQAGKFYLLEANSVPGMTDHSLVPMAAKQAGLSFNDLVWQILESRVEVSI
ncbi:MAG: D-alanine--D-alanine ligase [Gammaproteobacteria bacterium]|nr:D-alanine--D-alanine ligase [Gammaproteobacteria bacterium]